MTTSISAHLELYKRLGLTAIPLKPRSKQPLVKWRDGWKPTSSDLELWAAQPDLNWAVRCGAELAVLDFDNAGDYQQFIISHSIPASAPVVKTGRGYHLWVKPKRALPSQKLPDLGCELKCVGSYVVGPPSVHPNGASYIFEVAPSDFALRYGKSPYPQSLCGKATKILTRSDGKVKHLVSLRCWKWHCLKCAPLLKQYWLGKLSCLSFRFILRLPTMAKPTTFLRHAGKADYVHIVANGGSWLFLTDGETKKVWQEAYKTGYELIAGDVSGDPSADEVRVCLDQALCPEDKPLNTRRKISHSRGLFKNLSENNTGNESKQKDDCDEGEDGVKTAFGNEPLTWESEVVMKPIQQLAKELEAEGWKILWQSEVEALAIKDKDLAEHMDIVQLLDMLGVKLKRVGKEYMGLCPFHDDHNPSLSVNREKGLWHCFAGCGGGTAYEFTQRWQAVRGSEAQ